MKAFDSYPNQVYIPGTPLKWNNNFYSLILLPVEGKFVERSSPLVLIHTTRFWNLKAKSPEHSYAVFFPVLSYNGGKLYCKLQ